MKIQFLAISFLILSACSIGGGHNKSDNPTTPVPNKLNIPLALLTSKTDPVCGMELEEGGVEDSTYFKGKVIGFCNIGCKEEFLKEPAKYFSAK